MFIEIKDLAGTQDLGLSIGRLLKGGEIIELVGDVGSGKTTLVQAIGLGLGVKQIINSPSFSINRIYDCRNNLRLAHYDFYRLIDAGIMKEELRENLGDNKTVTIIEWGDIIKDILPSSRITIKIRVLADNERQIQILPEGFLR